VIKQAKREADTGQQRKASGFRSTAVSRLFQSQPYSDLALGYSLKTQRRVHAPQRLRPNGADAAAIRSARWLTSAF